MKYVLAVIAVGIGFWYVQIYLPHKDRGNNYDSCVDIADMQYKNWSSKPGLSAELAVKIENDHANAIDDCRAYLDD